MLTLNTNPPWLKKRLLAGPQSVKTGEILSSLGLNTVCAESACPNLNECFSGGQATFLILGRTCTRRCLFCSVEKGLPQTPDESEPYRIRDAVRRLNLGHVVITSVTRDDLNDGGAGQFVKVIDAIRALRQEITIEALVPDFRGNPDSIDMVLSAGADVFSHNIETIGSLYPSVRQGADYKKSLGILQRAKSISKNQVTKSGIMVGLGENEKEVLETITDIAWCGCDILTIGQYLRPGAANLPVRRYVLPEEFVRYREFAIGLGFKYAASGPFVRSSYKAKEMYSEFRLRLTVNGCATRNV
ncbi:MAG: lipoyl synthase [Candidatus Omnitrophota bacterium]